MEERTDTVSRRNDIPVRMSPWERVRSRKREPKTPTDVAEKNVRIKRVKKRTSTSATAHENYFSSNFLLLLKRFHLLPKTFMLTRIFGTTVCHRLAGPVVEGG